MKGGALNLWPGRFLRFGLTRGRLLRNMRVFAENSTPGHLPRAGRLLTLLRYVLDEILQYIEI